MKRAANREALIRAIRILGVVLLAELAGLAMLIATSGALPASAVKADTLLMVVGSADIRDTAMPPMEAAKADAPDPEEADMASDEPEEDPPADDAVYDDDYGYSYDYGYGYDYDYDDGGYVPEGGYDADYFRRMGVIPDGDYQYTWYSQRVLPGGGLDIPGRTVNGDGYVTDGDGNICLASSDLPYGTVVETPFGTGVVYDDGCDSGTLDVYTDW